MKAYHKILALLNFTDTLKDDQAAAVYFLGIGGIGMSSLARYFNMLGVKVSGYDKTETALTKQLSEEGILIHYEDNVEKIDRSAQIIIYTPAVPKDHKELNFYQQNKYIVVKRSDVLSAITNDSFNVCIAGTHGKTTTSIMIGHLLRNSEFGCNAFVGGIAVNYNTNFWSSEKNVCVVEADEYDRSFLKLSPDVAIITSMDADHLDIYGTAENMEQAFIDFSAKVKNNGLLISKHGLKRNADLISSNHLTYHLNDTTANIYAANIKMYNGSYHFDVVVNSANSPHWMLKNIVLNMGGQHNVENMIAAISVAHHVGIEDEKIRNAVATFSGVKRRFEYILKTEKQVFIDDYAHHPEELKALITGAKQLFANKKCIVVFQPHLFSRTRDFAESFAAVLDLADEAILLPIYPARELPMAGVSSNTILELMHNENKSMMDKDHLLEHLKSEIAAHVEEGFEGTVLITAGAGDIDKLVNPIRAILLNN